VQGLDVKRGLSTGPNNGKGLQMREDREPPTREERLAARLRENLKRRKAQARSLDASRAEPLSKEDSPR